jgi:hypothetical protein
MYRRIDITAAGTHNQALQRGEAKGGVDALAIFHCGHRAAVAQVYRYQINLIERLAEEACAFAGDEFV